MQRCRRLQPTGFAGWQHLVNAFLVAVGSVLSTSLRSQTQATELCSVAHDMAVKNGGTLFSREGVPFVRVGRRPSSQPAETGCLEFP